VTNEVSAGTGDISESALSEDLLLDQIRWMRLITDNVAANIAYIDTEQRLLFVNKGLTKLLGLTREELYGRHIGDVLNAVDYEHIRLHTESALGGKEATFEQERLTPEGRRLHFQTSLRPHFDSSGQVVGCFIMLVDITARVRAEAELQRTSRAAKLLHDIAVAANDATSPDEAIQLCLDAVCAYTGWPVGHAFIPASGGDGEFESTKLWHIDDSKRFELVRSISEIIGFKPGMGLPGIVLDNAIPHWIDDITTHRDDPRAELIDEIGARSAFAFPVMVGQQVVAVLEFFANDIQEKDDLLLDVTAQVGLLMGRVIERGRNEELREDSQRRLVGIVDIASEAIISIRPDGCISLFNKGAETIFGATAGDMVGQSIDQLLPERFRAGHSQHIAAFLEAPEPSRMMNGRLTICGQRADGTEFPAEASISKLELHNETVLTVILRDMTNHVGAEEA
jgi:PAS domain S-box-containing protein